MEKRALLIAGASHTGKSTLARKVSNALGWDVLSTDSMSRHPGRPWPAPPAHVAAFYGTLSANVIDTLVLHHHENMWPLHRSVILERQKFVFEGSALRPDLIQEFHGLAHMIVLHLEPETLHQRIIENAKGSDIGLVDAFAARAIRENDAFKVSAQARGIPVLERHEVSEFLMTFTSHQ